MPAITPALWIAIASLAATGATTGYEIASAPKSGVDENALKAQQQAQANQQKLQNEQRITASQGQAQAQTGGSLTDTGFQDFAAQLAGLPGYGGTAAAAKTATTAGVNNTGQPQVDMQSILAQLGQGGGGNITGGSGTQQTAAPQQFFELSSPVV